MAKYDLKREHKALYAPKNTAWELIDVPRQQFISIEGSGNPNISAEYSRAVEALFAVAYAIKFASKGLGRDFVVGPLEGLWWADDLEVFITRNKDAWKWRLLIAQPEWITDDTIGEARDAVASKRDNPAIDAVSRHVLEEGPSAQMLHVGAYDDEAPVLQALHDRFLPENDLQPTGFHHEVYLSDPRKTEISKLRTVLRQPVEKLAG